MPSETPMLLKRIPSMDSFATSCLATSAMDNRCMLHGLPSYHTDEMPICGSSRFSGAYSRTDDIHSNASATSCWLCGPAASAGFRWVMVEENLFARFAKAEAGCMLSAVPTPGFTATSSSDALPPVGCGSVVDPTRASVFDAVLCMRTATHALGNAPRDDNVRGLVIIVTAAGEQTRQAWCRVRERAPP